jgi:hypothetical protein
MPSYFCCRCHDLITCDLETDPNTIVCEKCTKLSAQAVKGGVKKDQNEDKDKANIEICPISDWK